MAQINVTEIASLVQGDIGFRTASDILAQIGIRQLVEEADNLSSETKLRANGLLIASIILYALACESGLKTKILEMEGEGDTHDLEVLFGRLPEDVRKDIRQRVETEIKGSFDEMLSENKLVQESWQRFYKGGVVIYDHCMFLKTFAHAINIHCAEVIKRTFSGMKGYLRDNIKGS